MHSSEHPGLSWLARLHNGLVHRRRVRVLVEMLAHELPKGASILDIGCGDGMLAHLLAESRPDIAIEGVEVSVRPGCRIPCRLFTGGKLPFDDSSFDVCLFIDVLHHSDELNPLIQEARRVCRSSILIKDHLSENAIDRHTLQIMDWVGNRPHGVRLPFNYLSKEQWLRVFHEERLKIEKWISDVPLYSFPLSLIVGRGLHFVAVLKKI